MLGREHPDTALSLNNLGSLYQLMGDYANAEPLHQKSLEINRKVLGPEHENTALSMLTLGKLYSSMGDYVKAESLYQKSLEINRKVLGPEHPDTATNLNDLGMLYQSLGDYANAEPLLQKSFEIRTKMLGPEHPDTATSLINLGVLYQSLGDYVKAESLYQKGLEINGKVLGQEHPNTATNLNNLGMLYQLVGDYIKAEPLLQKSFEISRKVLGQEHADTATSLNNLGALYSSMGDYVKAESLYQESLEIYMKVFGQEHPKTALGLNNLASLYQSMGEYTKAEPLLQKSLKIRTKILSKEHPYTAVSLNNLGYLYRAMGDYAKAEPYCRQSLLSTLNLLEQTSLVQSERQQLAMGQSFRFQLDSYLTLALEANQFGEQAFRKVLAWKGATLVRQRQLRKVADEEETAPLFAKLQQTATRLSTLALRVPDLRQLAVWKRQIDELSAEKERLEVELSRKSAAFRDTKKRVTLETLLAALPQDTVLIDFLEYDRSTFDKQKKRKTQFERSLVAFVIRKGQPIEPIDLGPVQPVEKDIDAWRTTFGATAEGRAAALSLRKRIWQPLEAQLAGAKTILVSPDGVLGRLPLAALPGKTKGKYLIEEYRIATIPVPQLLPALMKRQEGKELVGGLLLLGDVDYDADPQSIPKKRRRSWHKNRSTAMVRGERSFDQLDATAGEIAAIKELFTRLFKPQDDEIKTLSRTQSTEAIFRKAAPGYYNLHLATHGFFADPTKKSATKADPAQRQLQLSHQRVTGHHPGLLSGLAFAGANRKHDPDKDDGILTAEEIVTIRLDGCDLVVLSACETGLGKVAGGEGLLGVQRAFQVAGARSTVASLWKVDDAATRQLMERFYRNYWEREMGKLEALREAQLWMLRERGSRGLTDLDQDKEIKRLPPFYWAAFVLSGDWR
ncbi:MAG: CHAT domain-containing protein [Planctomycetes bacterium]|nr:CHAT domain-containing protein [Planctomycetota bacterium]